MILTIKKFLNSVALIVTLSGASLGMERDALPAEGVDLALKRAAFVPNPLLIRTLQILDDSEDEDVDLLGTILTPEITRPDAERFLGIKNTSPKALTLKSQLARSLLRMEPSLFTDPGTQILIESLRNLYQELLRDCAKGDETNLCYALYVLTKEERTFFLKPCAESNHEQCKGHLECQHITLSCQRIDQVGAFIMEQLKTPDVSPVASCDSPIRSSGSPARLLAATLKILSA